MSIQADINRDFHDLLTGPAPKRPTVQKWRVTVTHWDESEETRILETPYDRSHGVMLDAVKALAGCTAWCKIHRGHGYKKMWAR